MPVIDKVVIPAAGLGTRLLSATKEQPKEMLPVFAQGRDGTLCLKPLVQLIFEQLFDFKLRKFYFIVGRGKRAIEDHFTPDRDFIQRLNSRGKNSQATELDSFYKIIQMSSIVWVNQPEPKGFGHAVLQAEHLVGDSPFLVHAGDTYIISKTRSIIERLTDEHRKRSADVTLTLQEMTDPRQYGVAETTRANDETIIVNHLVEKPSQPKSKLAIMPMYVFTPAIFEALKATSPDHSGEIQLTNAIQRLVDLGHKVQAIKLDTDDIRLDIGTPKTYWEALNLSYKNATTSQTP